MARHVVTRHAPFGAESTLAVVRAVEAAFRASARVLRRLSRKDATEQLPARALADVGLTRAEKLGTRYSQVAARV